MPQWAGNRFLRRSRRKSDRENEPRATASDNLQAFWVTYVLGAFQEEVEVDNDPATEEDVILGLTPLNHGGCWVFLETIVDVCRDTEGWEAAEKEKDTVVHEVGHAPHHTIWSFVRLGRHAVLAHDLAIRAGKRSFDVGAAKINTSIDIAHLHAPGGRNAKALRRKGAKGRESPDPQLLISARPLLFASWRLRVFAFSSPSGRRRGRPRTRTSRAGRPRQTRRPGRRDRSSRSPRTPHRRWCRRRRGTWCTRP